MCIYIFFISWIIIHLVTSTEDCISYRECSNQSTITSPSQNNVNCYASFGCQATDTINSGNNIFCCGSRSCGNVATITYHADNGQAHCLGSESCFKSTLIMNQVRCYGLKSCINAEINNATEVQAYGEYSLLNASIISTNKNTTITLKGHNAGNGLNIQCDGSSICSINCYSTACSKVNLNGTGTFNVIYSSEDTIKINTTFNHFNGDNVIIDAVKNDIKCVQNFDEDGEAYVHTDIFKNGTGSMCCRGHRSCANADMILIMNSTLLCSASRSCEVIGEIKGGERSNIICSGYRGCYDSKIITKGDVYCEGSSGCQGGNITTSHDVICSGYWGCYQANIYISGDSSSSIILSGYGSGKSLSIFCREGAFCFIACRGTDSCSDGTIIECIGAQCEVECSLDTGCPQIKSLNPTKTPTNAPSESPSFPPTSSPTFSPSTTPTFSPTFSPTQLPTMTNPYDSYIGITYSLRGLTPISIQFMLQQIYNTTNDIRSIIETGYVVHKLLIEEWRLNYYEFTIEILTINDMSIAHISRDKYSYIYSDEILLKSRILCDKFQCNYIIKDYDKQKFEETVTTKLRVYFNESIDTPQNIYNLLFSVKSMDDKPSDLYPASIETPKYFFYAILIISASISLLGIIALVFNKTSRPKLPGFNIVDDGKWMALIIFSLQLWDFASDCNLSYELWTTNNIWSDVTILIISVGVTLFIFIPYTVNLFIAIRIKRVLKNNQAAKTWFQHRTPFFCILVVLTGGCYASLSLVSSNIFGHSLFSSGLTQYELVKLSKIKVFGTIILENLPQLILQAMYAVHINTVTQAVGIAFCASILSITVSGLIYLIDRDDAEINVIEYYLTMQCEHNLTDEETKNIINNKGKTDKLSKSLCALYEIQPKNIEVGATVITSHGVRTHIVHYIYQREIDAMDSKLSPMIYAQQLYQSVKEEIFKTFRDHFDVTKDFEVSYDDFSGTKRKQISVSNKQTIVPNMIKQSDGIEVRLESVLREYMNINDETFDTNKDNMLKMIQKMKNEILTDQKMDEDVDVVEDLQPSLNNGNGFNFNKYNAEQTMEMILISTNKQKQIISSPK
eukprot:524596_1